MAVFATVFARAQLDSVLSARVIALAGSNVVDLPALHAMPALPVLLVARGARHTGSRAAPP